MATGLLALSLAALTTVGTTPAAARAGVMMSGSSGVTAVAFSPDGTLLASADTNGTVGLWNPASSQQTDSALQAGTAVNAVAFGRDGKLAGGGANGVVLLWGPIAGEPVGRGSGYWIILAAAVIALALAALTAVITIRETRPASQR